MEWTKEPPTAEAVNARLQVTKTPLVYARMRAPEASEVIFDVTVFEGERVAAWLIDRFVPIESLAGDYEWGGFVPTPSEIAAKDAEIAALRHDLDDCRSDLSRERLRNLDIARALGVADEGADLPAAIRALRDRVGAMEATLAEAQTLAAHVLDYPGAAAGRGDVPHARWLERSVLATDVRDSIARALSDGGESVAAVIRAARETFQGGRIYPSRSDAQGFLDAVARLDGGEGGK